MTNDIPNTFKNRTIDDTTDPVKPGDFDDAQLVAPGWEPDTPTVENPKASKQPGTDKISRVGDNTHTRFNKIFGDI